MEKNGINILIVEDNPADFRLVAELLKESVSPVFACKNAVRLDEALKMLKEDKFDIVLLDIGLPDSSGFNGLEKIFSMEPLIPIIILTGINDENIGIQALQKHAADYLVKGQINTSTFKRSIRYSIERKRAEEALQQSEERLSALYSTMTVGIALHEIIYDGSGTPVDYRILEVNPAYESIMGVHTDMVVGKLASVLDGASKPKYLDVYERVAVSGKPEIFETYYEASNKHFKIAVFSPSKGKFATVFEDITENKCAEEILKNKNLHLQELDKKKSEFVSTVAHDLRTPLTSIMGFADTIAKKNLNLTEEQKETFIGYIQEESRRLSRLISEYLDISNIDEGKFEMNLKKTDLKQVISKTVEMFRSNSKNIRLSAEFPADLPELELDQDRIRQVLQNLIDNAIKYSPTGSSVSVLVKKSSNEILVSVSDEGHGVPDNEKEKIFLKFYRASSAASKEAPGTGLGLTIAKSIVERHKGKIWAEDNSPSGSCFIFTLPVNC